MDTRPLRTQFCQGEKVMRKLLLLLAVAVALSLTGYAQSSGTSQGEPSKTKTTTTKTKSSGTEAQAATKESQLTGCLAKSADGKGYTLTNGRYKKGVEVKSSEDLSAHVGHEVKLMGSWEKPTAGAEGGAGAKGGTMRTFDATSLKHIADTCTAAAAGGGTKGGGKKGAAAEKPPGM
jgi:hypothetical protein